MNPIPPTRPKFGTIYRLVHEGPETMRALNQAMASPEHRGPLQNQIMEAVTAAEAQKGERVETVIPWIADHRYLYSLTNQDADMYLKIQNRIPPDKGPIWRLAVLGSFLKKFKSHLDTSLTYRMVDHQIHLTRRTLQ